MLHKSFHDFVLQNSINEKDIFDSLIQTNDFDLFFLILTTSPFVKFRNPKLIFGSDISFSTLYSNIGHYENVYFKLYEQPILDVYFSFKITPILTKNALSHNAYGGDFIVPKNPVFPTNVSVENLIEK